MRHVVAGQVSLITCCAFYLVWWYRGFRPGVTVSRVGGTNGILLLITAVLGVAGIILSLHPIPAVREYMIDRNLIVFGGIAAYILLLFITKTFFHRIVTTELILITGWTMLEIAVINRLYAAEVIGSGGFLAESIVIAIAFVISIILYVAYYRMEEMRAFYAAMVPLVTEAAAMIILTFHILL